MLIQRQLISEYVAGLPNSPQAPLIAVLHESNTGYGAAGDPLSHEGKPPLSAMIVKVPFPMHIAHLSKARADALESEGANLPRFSSFDTSLKIPEDGYEGVAESIPAQSEAMTAVIHDLVLTRTLRALAAEGVKYVMIVATDPRDKIFLASAIREYCPDAGILTTLGDQLYSHPDYRQYLAGAFVGSSYPLYPNWYAWRVAPGDPKQRLVFSEQNSQAFFNAVAAQLKKPSRMLGYSNGELSIWISRVGIDGAAPYKTIAISDPELRGTAENHKNLDELNYAWRPTNVPEENADSNLSKLLLDWTIVQIAMTGCSGSLFSECGLPIEIRAIMITTIRHF